tara:strand:- start:49 stop:1605 length:1557 start_codon:yes stop_codon:yes gene_type:complete
MAFQGEGMLSPTLPNPLQAFTEPAFTQPLAALNRQAVGPFQGEGNAMDPAAINAAMGPQLAGPTVNQFRPTGSDYTPQQLSTPVDQLQQQNIPSNVVPIDPTAGLAATDPNLQGVTPFSTASSLNPFAPQASIAPQTSSLQAFSLPGRTTQASVDDKGPGTFFPGEGDNVSNPGQPGLFPWGPGTDPVYTGPEDDYTGPKVYISDEVPEGEKPVSPQTDQDYIDLGVIPPGQDLDYDIFLDDKYRDDPSDDAGDDFFGDDDDVSGDYTGDDLSGDDLAFGAFPRPAANDSNYTRPIDILPGGSISPSDYGKRYWDNFPSVPPNLRIVPPKKTSILDAILPTAVASDVVPGKTAAEIDAIIEKAATAPKGALERKSDDAARAAAAQAEKDRQAQIAAANAAANALSAANARVKTAAANRAKVAAAKAASRKAAAAARAAADRAVAASAAQASRMRAKAQSVLDKARSTDRGGPSQAEINAAIEVMSQVDTFGGGSLGLDGGGFDPQGGTTGSSGMGAWT